MKRLFLDTNIVIDFLARRSEFLPAANLIQMAVEGEHVLFMSPLSVANITYILRKDFPKDLTKQKLQQLCRFIKISPITEKEINKAFFTENPDMEDAIQYFSAESIGADCIITRDPKHFNYATIPVMNASEYLAINVNNIKSNK